MAQEAGPVGAFPPPPGRVPNFAQPEDLGRTNLVVGLAVMAGLTTIMFGLRSYSKMALNTHWYTEDLSGGFRALCVVICSWIATVAHYGEGYHEWEVTKEAYKEVLRWLYIGSILYCPAAYLTKATLLLLGARVFAVYERVSRGVFTFIYVLLFCYTPIMMLKVLVCIPVAATWDSDIKPANCLNQRKVFISDMCLGVFTDIIILLLPLVMTFSLRLPFWTKVKVVALLSAGGIATAVSIFRLYKSILFLEPSDRTEGFVLLDITTALELSIGLVCACLPTINLLIQKKLDVREFSPNRPRTGHSRIRKRGRALLDWSFGTPWTANTLSSRGRSLKTQRETLKHPSTLSRTNSDDNWSYDPRATSIDGRREGWLKQAQGIKQQYDLEAFPVQAGPIREIQKDWNEAWNQRLPPNQEPRIEEVMVGEVHVRDRSS
ncbi:3-beta hydroxysteroid dehydrogenase isomerase family protein [Colletotrichum kahawae]|uniref:3-beta hydroxysteroid dehydrogenase isomerase family protein n=1 Tax=Colletotrichum kahawae TaxID=34407 RepID=A0AAD9YRV8_COLKA|nr:3-beta hydroxysteroid dehydrogenase isomerase family protein [Colletotrichum kahawae]